MCFEHNSWVFYFTQYTYLYSAIHENAPQSLTVVVHLQYKLADMVF